MRVWGLDQWPAALRVNEREYRPRATYDLHQDSAVLKILNTEERLLTRILWSVVMKAAHHNIMDNTHLSMQFNHKTLGFCSGIKLVLIFWNLLTIGLPLICHLCSFPKSFRLLLYYKFHSKVKAYDISVAACWFGSPLLQSGCQYLSFSFTYVKFISGVSQWSVLGFTFCLFFNTSIHTWGPQYKTSVICWMICSAVWFIHKQSIYWAFGGLVKTYRLCKHVAI